MENSSFIKKALHGIPVLITRLFILAGAVEAVWGLAQVYGFTASNHSLYALTGSFYNPGPYSGFLAMTLPVCLYEWLKRRKEKKTAIYYIALSVLVLLICVLPAGMSRSAWMAGAVSSAYIAYMHYRKEIHAYIRCHRRRTKVGAILLVLLAGGMLAGVYLMKKDSADGRLLMWKVSVRAIAGQPWRGYGWDGVPGAYGQAQEDYFSAGNYTETEERVAGSPEYVFNEYLQVAMAWGVPVLLMALLVVGGSGYAGHRQKEYGLCGALLSLAVFSFSSYPFQFLLFVVALALLVTGCAIKTLSSRRPLVCMAGTVFLLLSAGYGCYRVYRWKEVRETASSAWHRKQMFYRSGAYEQAAEVYAEIYEDMKWNARYLFEYGHALHKLHRNEESNVVMKEALKVSGDPMILNIIGKNEQEAGNYAETEYWLIRSTHRLPGRIYPYFLLAKLYAEPGFYQRQKLEQAARMVMEKEPKVQSTAIRQMREEIKKLL